MKKLLLLPILLLPLTAHAACTDEEIEKINWIKASEYRKLKMDKIMTAIGASKTKIDAEIQKVEGGEWPLVEEKAEVKTELVADDTWEGVR